MEEPSRPKRPWQPWQPWQYIALVVIAILLAVLLLHPLGLELVSPFQAITNALSRQQR